MAVVTQPKIMKKILVSALLLICPVSLLLAQIDEKLKEDIRNTGYVHSPLTLDYSNSFESFGLTKKVFTSQMLCDMDLRQRMQAKKSDVYSQSLKEIFL